MKSKVHGIGPICVVIITLFTVCQAYFLCHFNLILKLDSQDISHSHKAQPRKKKKEPFFLMFPATFCHISLASIGYTSIPEPITVIRGLSYALGHKPCSPESTIVS